MESGKTKIEALAELVSGENRLSGLQTVPPSGNFLGQRGEFPKDTNPSGGLHPHDLSTSQWPSLANAEQYFNRNFDANICTIAV